MHEKKSDLKVGDDILYTEKNSVTGQDMIGSGGIKSYQVKNNLAYANLDATQTEIEEAAKYSFADEFINKLPQKYETQIGENGVRLSGGEKQRLSIARAMLKKAPIILLDEATSSLDSKSEKKIQDAINKLMQGKTSLIIAHKFSTIKKCDKIILIDKGRIIAQGTHEELINSNSSYKNMNELQM